MQHKGQGFTVGCKVHCRDNKYVFNSCHDLRDSIEESDAILMCNESYLRSGVLPNPQSFWIRVWTFWGDVEFSTFCPCLGPLLMNLLVY